MFRKLFCNFKTAVTGLSLAIVAFSNTAIAGPTLVVDLSSGRVLHAEQATRPWYPASLTKMMTLYVALDAVRRGKISFQTPMRVTARAARMVPSKMGFRPGVEITLENALKIIMVKSANDVSVTIAEGISGSVEGFAAEMNATARALGMRESHFVNPNGLHHPSHISSARDMAILGRALFLHFPDKHELYGIGAIRFGRRVMRNYNGVIGRYHGANGIKTGFVCASGYNVVASATRSGRTIIAVVMGSPSGVVRTFQSIALLDKGFASTSYGASQLQSLPRSAYSAPPNMRSEICNRRRRRQLIQQYMLTAAPPVAASTSSSFRSYAESDQNNNPAAFFAADQNKGFVTGGTAAAQSNAKPGGRLRLPPRARAIPIRVRTGRAPGWAGKVAGPAAATPAVITTPSKEAEGKTRTAARGEEKAGSPLRLQGAPQTAQKSKAGTKASKKAKASRKAKTSRRASLRKQRAIKRKKLRRSRAKNRRKTASRKASRSRKTQKSKRKIRRSKATRR